jgi:hypothetical protein
MEACVLYFKTLRNLSRLLSICLGWKGVVASQLAVFKLGCEMLPLPDDAQDKRMKARSRSLQRPTFGERCEGELELELGPCAMRENLLRHVTGCDA